MKYQHLKRILLPRKTDNVQELITSTLTRVTSKPQSVPSRDSSGIDQPSNGFSKLPENTL